ncbi:Flp pilus assembly protein CpaB [Nocardioides sp. Kera G14]|uniref:Flp pilus assembly protein CpaB n=1 Tax=Nocardioides sp. Kera G14 TaxID=2884264 RepID=UPI001D0FF6EB|nr:Flp pilus assembly protein CpaB [Nocardioides sp. Kera G14]UDY22523.1 Flp pilus assembly protein CpaB [Nocardioides sp. Kera G14]
MERRRILVVAAALVAALGAVLVFLYVRSADNRAEDQYQTTEVLVAASQINPGETIEAATGAGKIVKKAVANGSLLADYQTDTSALTSQVALTTIYPGEQIVASKFGTTAAPASALQIPKNQVAVSVNLTDPARVAGFVNPGSQVGIYMTGTDPKSGKPFAQVLLPSITVIGVGSTTPVSTTTTDQTTGNQTTEQLPRTLLTLAVSPADAQKILFAQGNGELAFALLPADGSTSIKPGAETDFDNLFG